MSDGRRVSTDAGDVSGARAHIPAAVLLSLLAFAAFSNLLVTGEVPMFRDHRDYFQPLRYYTAAELKEWRLPLWNPYSASGERWLANPQTGVFYPPSWIFLLVPFARAYVLYLALHVAILGIGTYRMLAARVSREAAVVGAAILMASGPVFSLVDISNNLATFAWIPWVLWCALAERAAKHAGIFIALAFLAGEPFFAALAALLYVIVVRRPRTVLVAGAIAFGLSAVQLLPFVEMLWGSDRAAGLPREQMFRDSATAGDWLRMAVPPGLTHDVIDPALSQHFISIVYVGIAAVVLAALGVVLNARRALPWLTLLAVALAVSVGPGIPLVAAALENAPVTLFRYPARMIAIGALTIAAIAAMGWDRLRRGSRWADALLLLLVLVDVAPHSMRVLLSAPFRSDRLPYDDSLGRDTKILRIGDRVGADRSAWIAGYYNLFERRFDTWSAAPVMSSRYDRWHGAAFSGERLDLVNRCPAGWILSNRDLGGRFAAVSKVRNVTAYRNQHALPMAAVWSAPRAAANGEQALSAALAPANFGHVFISPPPAVKRSVVPAVAPARIVNLDANSATVAVSAPFAGVLILTQQDAPGWRVSIDGVPAKKLLADGIFRAVAVESGQHLVHWTYVPQSLILGSAVTIVTLAFLQFGAFVKRRREQKFSS